MTTTETRQDTLGEATLGEFAEGLRGELVRPTDPSYDEARTTFQSFLTAAPDSPDAPRVKAQIEALSGTK